jgi:type IV fimbrial biogenesis protein FimT
VHSAGFTLIELMLALTVLAILLGVAGPSFLEAQRNVVISGQANDLHADLALARSEAVKRNQAVMLCASSNQTTCGGLSWAQGWMIFADANGNGAWDAAEVPLKSRGPLGGATTLVSAGHLVAGGVAYVPYYPSGVSTTTGVDFVLCDARTTPNTGRNIEINLTGRPSVVRVTCPMTPSL